MLGSHFTPGRVSGLTAQVHTAKAPGCAWSPIVKVCSCSGHSAWPGLLHGGFTAAGLDAPRLQGRNARVSASGTFPQPAELTNGHDARTGYDQRQAHAHPRMSPQALTRRIKESETWHKLLLLLRSHHQEMDHIHICALLSRTAHLHSGSKSGFHDDAEREQYNNFISDLVATAQGHMRQYTARAVASTVYALAVLGVKNEEFLHELAALAATMFSNFNPQELSNMLWGFAKQGYHPSAQWMRGFLHASQALLWKFKPQELCNTAYSLAVLDVAVEDEWRDNFLAVVQHQTKNFKSQDFGNLAWSLGKLEWQVAEAWVDDFVMGSTTLLGYFKPQELSNMAWGLAVLGHSPRPEWLRAFLIAAETKAQLTNPQDIANLLWACAKFGAGPSTVWLERMLEWGSNLLGDFKGQDLANVLWAIAELGVKVRAHQREVLMLAVFYQAPELGAEDLAAVMYALAKTRWGEGCNKDVSSSMLSALQAHAHAFNGPQITNVLWALARVDWPSARVLEGLVSCSTTELPSCDNSQLVAQLVALARLQHRPTEAWLKTWLDTTAQRLHTFAPCQLSDSLWALTELPTFVSPRRAWVDAFASVSKNCIHRFTPLELSRTILCLSKLDRHPGLEWLVAFESASLKCLDDTTPDNVISQLSGVVNLRHTPSKKWLAHVGLAIQRHHDKFDNRQLEIMLALLLRLNKPFALALYNALPNVGSRGEVAGAVAV